jgi:superfamily II DNA or RNA helicase
LKEATSPPVHLRDYQFEALARVRDAYKAGKRRVLVSLPTGTGKTVVFAHFPKELRMKKRLLVLAHREELLQQAADKFRMVDGALKIGIERAESYAPEDSQVVIASVPTLARADGVRLSRLNPESFSIVVVDEAHHAVAESYRRIFRHLGILSAESSRYLVGFTATPRRGDNQGLGEVFEEVCYARDLRQMISAGHLCQIRGWRVDTGLSLNGVSVRHGDFVEGQLARVVNTPSRNKLLTVAYMRLTNHRRALVFCVDVKHAKDVCDTFKEAGIRAETVWGEMPGAERRETLGRFSRGEVQVLTNCNLLTEGFDEPAINCVMMARPTKSKLLYAQMVGRGTRLHPGKTDLMVVDLVDNSQSHTLPGLYSLFDLPSKLNLGGARALEVERVLRRLIVEKPWIDTSRIQSPDDIQLCMQRIEFFNFDPPPEIASETSLTWYLSPGGYRLNLPDGEALTIETNLLDTWDVQLWKGERSRLLATVDKLPRAVAIADSFVHVERSDAAKLVARGAGWRNHAPTERQLEILVQHGITVPEGLTKGQVSQIISHLFVLARK